MSETKPQRRILRRVGAVLAGLLFVIIITTTTDALMHATGIFPPWGQPMSDSLFVLALAYRIVYGIVGGYITARLAPDQPVKHALVLGVIGFVLSLAGTFATWNRGPEFGPKWYPLALVVIAIPTAWLGGKLVSRSGPERHG
jgi:surface polysaccharide O-acyltransferase-like enzyme